MQIGHLFSANSNNNFSNVNNFPDNILSTNSRWNRPLSSLDIFNIEGQEYIGLGWHPEYQGNQYELIRQVIESKFEN
jgi:hypothetical protein